LSYSKFGLKRHLVRILDGRRSPKHWRPIARRNSASLVRTPAVPASTQGTSSRDYSGGSSHDGRRFFHGQTEFAAAAPVCQAECNRCKTRASLPLAEIRRPRNTAYLKLEAALKMPIVQEGALGTTGSHDQAGGTLSASGATNSKIVDVLTKEYGAAVGRDPASDWR
jgi:hypothetical protein